MVLARTDSRPRRRSMRLVRRYLPYTLVVLANLQFVGIEKLCYADDFSGRLNAQLSGYRPNSTRLPANKSDLTSQAVVQEPPSPGLIESAEPPISSPSDRNNIPSALDFHVPPPERGGKTGELNRPLDLGPPAVQPHREISGIHIDRSQANSRDIVPLQLDARELACSSANNWKPADVLRTRGRTIEQSFCDEDPCAQQAARVLRIFLNTQAAHQQDIGAASGLRAYYGRVAIAEQFGLIADGLTLLESEERKQEALQTSGLASGVDLTSFSRQRLELADSGVQLEAQDRRLRCVLAHLAGCDFSLDDTHLETLDVVGGALDCQALQQFALANRMDLRAWQYLACNVNEETAPLFAQMVPTIIGNWGLPLPVGISVKSLFCPPDHSQLASNMKVELNVICQTHRAWILQAVEEKCAKLTMTYQRVDLARQTIETWRQRLSQLDRLDELGDMQPGEASAARGELINARLAEIARRTEARTAEIDLAEAVGAIHERCCQGMPWLVTGTPVQ